MITLEEIEEIPRDYLLPVEVADYLHIYPQNLRIALRKDKSMLGVPAIIVGKMIKIPKIPFVKFMRGEN